MRRSAAVGIALLALAVPSVADCATPNPANCSKSMGTWSGSILCHNTPPYFARFAYTVRGATKTANGPCKSNAAISTALIPGVDISAGGKATGVYVAWC